MAEAETWLKSFVDQKANKIDLTGGQQTLGTWLNRWLDVTTEALKATTKADYAFKLGFLAPLAQMRLADIMPDHVDDVMSELAKQLANTTVRQIRSLLTRALREAVRRRYVTFNAAETDIHRQKAPIKKPVYRLSLHEMVLLLRAAEARPEYLAWWLLLVLGIREGEVLGLQRGDVDLDAATLTIRQQYTVLHGRAHQSDPKTKNSLRTLPIPRGMLPLVRRHLAALDERIDRAERRGTWHEESLIFPGKGGRPMNPTSLLHILVRDLLPAAHLPHVTVHHLRHNAASAYTNIGTPEIISGAILGHAPTSVTGHYARPNVDAMRPWVDQVYAQLAGEAERIRKSA